MPGASRPPVSAKASGVPACPRPAGLCAAGARVVVPEIADSEVRRERIRAGKASGCLPSKAERILGGRPRLHWYDDSMAKILLVEDNEDARETLAVLLRARGHTVSGVPNGREALAQILTDLP